MKIQALTGTAAGTIFLCELTTREISILTKIPVDQVEAISVGAEVTIDPESSVARESLAMSKRIALAALEDAVALDPSLRADVDVLLNKLGELEPVVRVP